MKKTDPAIEQYRQQLTEWVEAMAFSSNDPVYTHAAPGFSSHDVDLFTEGNFDKRAEGLEQQTEFLKPAFEDLGELIEEFISSEPLPAYETSPLDGAMFLRWLRESCELNPVQADYVTCRLARYEVEDVARGHRREHLQFQELWSVAGDLAADLGTNRSLRIHLNPIRVWARFETAEFLDGTAEPPVDVMFHAVRSGIHTVILEAPAPTLLAVLEQSNGLTLEAWAERAELVSEQELVALARDLAELGLVAFS